MRRVLLALGIVSLCLPLTVAGAKGKKEAPDATIKLSAGSVAAGVGVSWGKGTLTYKGEAHPISVSGLDVGSVGASQITASGNVYHLKSLADFDGNYTAASAGATIGGGGGAVAMKNQNGVVVKLLSTSRGVKLTIAASGVKMEVKK
jgi:hypothetical protein